MALLIGTEVYLGQGHIVFMGTQLPSIKAATPSFGPFLLWLNGRPSPVLLSSCTKGRPKTEMLRKIGPVIKSVESLLRPEGSVGWERFVEEIGHS